MIFLVLHLSFCGAFAEDAFLYAAVDLMLAEFPPESCIGMCAESKLGTMLEFKSPMQQFNDAHVKQMCQAYVIVYETETYAETVLKSVNFEQPLMVIYNGHSNHTTIPQSLVKYPNIIWANGDGIDSYKLFKRQNVLMNFQLQVVGIWRASKSLTPKTINPKLSNVIK